ncbi:unnamed protein product [Prorocentrum cordatum]|uniref:Integrase catalytic domain-containing protein n=1 Tax=Prorocentrum cordatum TaxID=2364126 RepID=A0ABN9XP88_9DINO|nr:unnamed protein product [Polarella glacialis]
MPDDETYEEEWADEWAGEDWAEDDDEESEIPPSSAEFRRTRGDRKKWRGGPCPAPPPLEARFQNIYKQPRYYQKWVRKVHMWKARARHYKPMAELALDLSDVITGEGAEMIESLEWTRLYSQDGIDLVINSLAVFDEQQILQVGDLMEEYEEVERLPGELLAAYVAHFKDLEMRLKRAELPAQQGRLVEITTKEAAKDEIDSHREVDSIQVMQEVADALTVTSDKLKKLTLGRGWTGSAARQAAADIASTATERHCDAAGRHVFFRKHSWNIYGRPIRRFKSTGGISEARVSPDVFEDRLQVTHLSPDELQQRVAAFKSRVATGDKGASHVRFQAAPEVRQFSVDSRGAQAARSGTKSSHQVDVIWHVRTPLDVCFLEDSQGFYIVIDTGCQRNVVGYECLGKFLEHIAYLGLSFWEAEEQERFRFGVSRAVSKSVVYFPICLEHVVPLVCRTSVLDVNPKLPFLGSLPMWKLLGLQLDTLGERAHFTKINLCDVPLKIAPNGHLLLRVDSWLKDVGFPREPEAWKFTPSDVIIPEPQWIPEEARSSRRTVQLTRQNLAINAWTNLMQLIMNHLSHIIGRSREQFRQNMEMSNRMMGTIAQMGHEMGYLTPMADSVKAIARGAAQVPESVLPPPPAPEDQAQNYSQLCEKRDVCAHPTTRRYYAKGYWLICDQCGRRWKSVNGKWIVMVKRGAWKRLLGIAKKTTAACETLINVSQDADRRAADLRDAEWCCSDVAFMDIPVPELPDHRYLDNECQACGTDLIEGCAGTARPTRLASRFELRASPSADIEDGWDLSTTRGAQRWKDQIQKDKPLYVIVGFPCTLWCSYNVNVNYVDHPELLERLRARDRRLIDLIKWTIKYQVKHGRFFLFENPPTSAIWKDLQFAPLLPLGETVIGHGCQYGKTGETGLPIRKAYRWFSNSPPALAALSRRCPGLRPESGGHLHDQIENSKWTKASGEYTDEMAHAMLHAIQQVAAQRNPSRFADMPVAATEWEVAYNHAGPIEVLFASPEKDPTRWEAVMQGVRQIVGGSASRGGNKAMHYLSKSSTLWRQISQLVPWDLTMIQLAKTAKQRRFPINKEPWSHRGHCYVDEKGHYHIEAEDLVDVAFPTLALSPPADLAVFFFGYAKQESLPQEPDTSQIEKRMPLPPDPNDPMLPNNSLPPDEDDDLQDVPIARMPDASGGMAGIRFVGVTKEQCPREVRQLVARMHCNLGHPVPSEFFQFLAQRGASQATLLCARALRCPACLRRKRPQRQRESQIPRVGLFNDLVKGDLFYVMTHDGTTHALLGLVDKATRLHVVCRIASREPGDVWEKFQTCWLTPFGIMQILVVDRDGAFEAVFMDNCHTLGIDVRCVPPGAHWQLGLAESGNYAWRRVFEKVIDVILPTMPEHVDLAIISTSHAVNQSVRRAGRTAYAAAFGRVPTLPTELLADTTSAEFWHNCTQDEMLAYGERCRIEALKAIADLEADEALRTSIFRQPVNRKEYDFLSGQRVAAWGEHGRKRRGKTPVAGYRPGIFCFWDSGTNGYGEGESAWLRIGHRTVQVAREHIRPAVGFEGWTPSEEDLKELKTAEQDLAKAGQGDASNITIEGPPEQQPEPEDPQARVLPGPLPAAPLEPILEEPAQASLGDNATKENFRSASADDAPEAAPNAELPQLADASESPTPTGQSGTRRRAQRRAEGEAPEPAAPFPWPAPPQFGPVRARERSATPTPRRSAPHTRESSAARPPSSGSAPSTVIAPPPEKKSRPGKLPHIPGSPSPAAFVSNESDEMEFITPDGWDGVEEPVLLRTRVFSSLAEVQEAYEAHLLPIENFENDPIDDSEPDDDWTNCLYMTSHELSDLRDGEMDVDCATAQVGDTTDSNNLSRREQRQLDREIPWREIAEYPEDQFMEYVKALRKECQNWDTWKSVRACSQEEAEQVRRDPHRRKRCIRSRVCYRDKNLGFPPLKAKARPVLLGFSDPDLEKLPRNAPVLTDAGKKLICQIAVSNDWRVGTGDAESAFLQGGAQSEREEAIYMIPPKDPIVQAAGVFTAPLYEVVGNLYGQSTAPYLWYKHVVTTFLALGSKLHSLDSALFLWFFPNNELACAVGMHVDDALAAHHPKFDFTPIEKAIKWRGWQWDNFVFLGEEYQRLRQGPYSGSLFVHQAAYTKAIAVTKVGFMASTRSSSKLTRSEREDLESAVGSLQWLSGHTRPDLSAAVSLVQRTDPELNDLRMAMKHVEYAHRTAQTGILIVRVDLSRACFVSFADSSWANAPGLKTQIGTLIFLADEVILTGPTSCTLLFHKSKRTPRVVRSTLAGEAIAQDLGVDYASYLSKFLSEMLTGRPAGRRPPIFEVITATDCKSLYDALHQLTPSLSEKRTVIDVISIRDEVKVKNVRWIPTTHMIADGMTKEDPKLRENLTMFLADPVLSLVESIACEELTGGDGQVQKK